jgi:hypothetical protein
LEERILIQLQTSLRLTQGLALVATRDGAISTHGAEFDGSDMFRAVVSLVDKKRRYLAE